MKRSEFLSKETFDGCCINMKGERLFSLSTSMIRKGFEELIKQLSGLSVSQESALVGMESTDCYPVNLYSFLIALGYTVLVMNPLLISNFVRLQMRKTKTDKKDAYGIAQFLLLCMTAFMTGKLKTTDDIMLAQRLPLLLPLG